MDYAISNEGMRAFDARSQEIIPEIILMENAGRCIAEEILSDIQGLSGQETSEHRATQSESAQQSGAIQQRQTSDHKAQAGARPSAPTQRRQIFFLIGRGHNGGDGLVAARHIAQYGAEPAERRTAQANTGHTGSAHGGSAGMQATVFVSQSELRPLCAKMLGAIQGSQIRVVPLNAEGATDLASRLESADNAVFVDAYLGSGINRPMLSADHFDLPALVQAWNASKALRYAVDVPSGALPAPLRSTEHASHAPLVFKADYTLAIQFPRCMLYAEPLRSRAGEIRILKTGFPEAVLREYSDKPTEHALHPVLGIEDLKRFLPTVEPSAHKGSRGKVDVYAGSAGLAGAALLASRSALHSGAGMVRIAGNSADISTAILKQEPALMSLPVPETSAEAPPQKSAETLVEARAAQESAKTQVEHTSPKTSTEALAQKTAEWAQCILAGPGWGSGREEVLRALLNTKIPIVIDADGLVALKNLYAENPSSCAGSTDQAGAHTAIRILSPHPGEAAMLLNCDTAEVIGSPFSSATAISKRYCAYTVLKSSSTIIADPAGNYSIFDGRNPALGTAGTGDVLAGILAALLARGLSPDAACTAGVLLHAAAGRRCFQTKGWFSASELISCLSLVAAQ